MISREGYIVYLHKLGIKKETIREICNIHIEDIDKIINQQPKLDKDAEQVIRAKEFTMASYLLASLPYHSVERELMTKIVEQYFIIQLESKNKAPLYIHVQSKLSKINEVVESALCYIKSDNWHEALKEIKQILEAQK